MSAIKEITHGAAGLSLMQGIAGVGKTTLIAEAKRQLEKSGLSVIGLAPTNKAVEELSRVGIEGNAPLF